MKIDEMLNRENFYTIIEKTLPQFSQKIFNNKTEIETIITSVKNNLFIYPKINAIITKYPSKKVREYIFNEFNVNDSILKYITAKIYVAFCLFSGGLLASKILKLSSNRKFNNILIWPCNRKIRILDFEKNIIDTYVKDGFGKTYFKKELDFRLHTHYCFVPSILDFGENWYRENILSGQSLARITNKNKYYKHREDALTCLKEINAETISYVDPVEYSEKLSKEIQEKIEIAIVTKNIDCADRVLKSTCIACKKAKELENYVPLVISHGDLQSGNIWVDRKSNKTYILDWETYGRRSIWYDSATLILSTRRANNFKEMMECCETDAVKNAVLANDNKKNYKMKSVMKILQLENILFYLDDVLELPQDFGGNAFNQIAGNLNLLGLEKSNE